MTFAPLLHALRSEAVRSPKKAAVLGLLLLVAVYFWAPLVVDWLGASDEPDADALAADAAGPSLAGVAPTENPPSLVPAASPTPAAAPMGATTDWRELVHRHESRRRARMLPLESSKRSLFSLPTPPPPDALEGESPAASEAVVSVESPDRLGIVLEGTMTRGGESFALINGRAYRTGEYLDWPSARGNESEIQRSSGGRGECRFRVEEIHRKGAVLSRNSQTFQLHADEPKLPEGERVVVVSP